ncbi:MAG: pentapeptide repeat-containing protein [Cyanobacteria bacterium J06643_4]
MILTHLVLSTSLAHMDCSTLIKQGVESWNCWRSTQADEVLSLAGQDLSHGYFFEGDFSGVDLTGADLRRACLIGADFSGANLTDADLRDAYLGDASFENANISNANFIGAHLNGVDLARANFLESALLHGEDIPEEVSIQAAQLEALKQRQQARKSATRNRVMQIAIARLSQRVKGHRNASKDNLLIDAVEKLKEETAS